MRAEERHTIQTGLSPIAQYTIEKIGKAESVTTFDTEYETLSAQLETIRVSTEKIVGHVQALVQPNPGQFARPVSHTPMPIE